MLVFHFDSWEKPDIANLHLHSLGRVQLQVVTQGDLRCAGGRWQLHLIINVEDATSHRLTWCFFFFIRWQMDGVFVHQAFVCCSMSRWSPVGLLMCRVVGWEPKFLLLAENYIFKSLVWQSCQSFVLCVRRGLGWHTQKQMSDATVSVISSRLTSANTPVITVKTSL